MGHRPRSYPYASQLPTYSTDIPTYGSSHYGAPTDVPAAPSLPAGGVQPSAETGGVSFEITPADAAVFVDGVYVGAARNFSRQRHLCCWQQVATTSNCELRAISR